MEAVRFWLVRDQFGFRSTIVGRHSPVVSYMSSGYGFVTRVAFTRIEPGAFASWPAAFVDRAVCRACLSKPGEFGHIAEIWHWSQTPLEQPPLVGSTAYTSVPANTGLTMARRANLLRGLRRSERRAIMLGCMKAHLTICFAVTRSLYHHLSSFVSTRPSSQTGSVASRTV